MKDGSHLHISKQGYHRPVRSFVRRNALITDAQKKALETLWPLYGIEFDGPEINLDVICRRKVPRILDIGSGMGATTVHLAKQYPQYDFIAVEVHRPGIGSTLKLANEHTLTNIYLIAKDIVEVLSSNLFGQIFDKVLIYFPDPWPKTRHHKRRLLTPDFVRQLTKILKSHGRLYIATDWKDYAEHILRVCDREPQLINLAGAGHYAPRPTWRPQTKFEARGRSLGHDIWDFVYAIKQIRLPA